MKLYGLVATTLAVACLPVGAFAAPGFQARAEGHAYQCGAHVVELGRDGSATLSTRDTPDLRAAKHVRWDPHGVRLSFRGGGKARLYEYGATVTLDLGATSAVCIAMR